MRCVVRLIVSWTRQKQRIHLFGVGQTDPHFQPLKITLLSYVHLYVNLYLPLTCGGGGARLIDMVHESNDPLSVYLINQIY